MNNNDLQKIYINLTKLRTKNGNKEMEAVINQIIHLVKTEKDISYVKDKIEWYFFYIVLKYEMSKV